MSSIIDTAVIVVSVLKKTSSRWVPAWSFTYTQAIYAWPSPALYQCPVPVVTPISRRPPHQATSSVFKLARATCCPCTTRPSSGED
jgi:hypothetical protein